MSGLVIGIIVAIVVIIVLAAIAYMLMRHRRSERLHEQFGSEYDRTVEQTGGTRRAESILIEREKRVRNQLQIRPLSDADRDRFANQWRDVQSEFVDDPATSLTDADRLVGEVMSTRGYPMGDFERQADDVSVDHPEVVQNYRIAHEIAQRQADGEVSTEDMRTAMLHYRSLFEDLLETPTEQEVRP
jgi:hypothetical protein